MINFKILLISSIILLILDMIYINLVILKTFKKMIVNIQNTSIKVRLLPAILCYIVLIFSLNYFILNTKNTLKQKMINAFILGLVIYSVYDLTNYATISNWNWMVVFIDSLWGGLLFAITTFLTYKLV